MHKGFSERRKGCDAKQIWNQYFQFPTLNLSVPTLVILTFKEAFMKEAIHFSR